ncbi:MAG: NAD(P)H nitroreductase [Desulfobulbus sp.]|nr:NAD(P)H nitroreductase [Desulfobulbus sp.]
MKFSALIRSRQSVRAYAAHPMEPEKLDQLIEAVRLAPSASNSQPWKIVMVTDPALKDQVAHATYSTLVSFNRFVPQAPVLAVFVIERPKVITQIGAVLKKRDFSLIDIGIAATHFCLQVTALGLSTCMLGWFDEKTVQKVLQIPRNKRIGLLISLGYASEDDLIREKKRKNKETMSSYNQY